MATPLLPYLFSSKKGCLSAAEYLAAMLRDLLRFACTHFNLRLASMTSDTPSSSNSQPHLREYTNWWGKSKRTPSTTQVQEHYHVREHGICSARPSATSKPQPILNFPSY